MRVLLSLLLLAPAVSTTPRSPVRGPDAARSAPDSLSDRLGRELTPWLDAQAKSGAFSGVVLVARNGTPIYSAAYGMADRARKVPNALDTRFNLGSMNKMWTAIAIAQLVDQGKVDLDATVGRYVPDLPNKAIRETVKIRHLLSHTSGMGTYFRKGFLRDKTYAAKVGDIVPFYADDSLSFTPGARMEYSNSGFALLGLIVERVSGQSFYDYMQKNILDRAGMKRAGYFDVRSHPTTVAIGYATPPGTTGEAKPNWDLIEQHSSPAGGAFASAADLVAFSRALWSGKLASAATVKDFTTGKVAMGPQMQYAYGFGVGDINGWRNVGHNGGIPGANAEFMMFPDKGIDVVVLANIDAPAATATLGRVIGVLTGTKLQFATDNGPQLATVDVGPDGQERRSGNSAPPGVMPAGPPPTLPPGARTDRLPDTEQGRRAAAFLEAYSKGEGPPLAAFLEKYAAPRPDRTIVERVKGMEGLYDRTGKLTFKRLVGFNDEQIRFTVDSEKDGELTISLVFEPAAPHRVIGINFEAGNRER